MNDSAVIAVRIAVLAVLYIFLLAALRVVWRDFLSAAPAGRGSIGRAELIVVEAARAQLSAGDRVPVEGAASIGRDSDNQVVVADGTVSGRHAAIAFRGGRWWVEDLGSTNGTWVNQERLNGPRPLADGDLIEVGRASFRFSG